MNVEQALVLTSAGIPHEFSNFRAHIAAEWIESALALSGTATIRRRRLPAEQVFWLVVGMALMRDESIERVCALLGLALPSEGRALVAKSAIPKARERLGAEPLEYVFTVSGSEWATRSADQHRWRGLALYGLDGTTLRVPDSEENWDAFGGQPSNGPRAGSAYPTVRLVGLMALRSHLLAALRFGPYSTGEVTLARELLGEIPNHSLTIVDRNFAVGSDLTALQGRGVNRHWLVRKRANTKLKLLKKLGPNDALVEISAGRGVRSNSPEMPPRWVARAIEYQRRGFKPGILLTSLLDPVTAPAAELIALYHERWELELGYDEVKTHLLARQETIRSRKPAGVLQEIWGIGLAYNLVRVEMQRVATKARLEPNRISFVNALALIRTAWLVWSTPPLAAAHIPAGIADLERQLAMLVLPERRSERAYPRAVKIKMSNYKRKPPTYRPTK